MMKTDVRKYNRYKKRRLHRLLLIIATAIFLAVAGVGAYFYYDYSTRVYKNCVVELGGEVKPDDFLKNRNKPAEFTLETVITTGKAGIYKVGIISKPFTYDCTLEVQDTVAPELTVHNLTRTREEIPEAEDFVDSVTDASNDVKVYLGSPIDLSIDGQQQVNIVAEDASGNKTSAEATLNLVKEYDIVPPVISGQLNRIVYVSHGASFKSGIVVTDNVDSDIELEVDSSKVDLDTPGEYPIIYTAKDSMGNMDLAEGVVKVIMPEYSEEEVYSMADEVLADIIKPDMSDYDKAHAIYVWVQGNIGYSESEDRDDWLKGAYDGLKNRHGDCYTYFSVSKVLLTRADIKNGDIEIIPTATRHHYWNVIDCGEGWRHFDTTPRTDKTFKGFYITDEELMAYSNEHYRSHNYDIEIYTYFK